MPLIEFFLGFQKITKMNNRTKVMASIVSCNTKILKYRIAGIFRRCKFSYSSELWLPHILGINIHFRMMICNMKYTKISTIRKLPTIRYCLYVCLLHPLQLSDEAGLPAGLLNVVTASRESTPALVESLTSHELVTKLSFTGSTAVGKLLMSQCAGTVKKLSLELGGNAPFIVFNSADVALAVQGTMASKYRNTGQTCVAPNRYVTSIRVHLILNFCTVSWSCILWYFKYHSVNAASNYSFRKIVGFASQKIAIPVSWIIMSHFTSGDQVHKSKCVVAPLLEPITLFCPVLKLKSLSILWSIENYFWCLAYSSTSHWVCCAGS